ncbi:hypothetical protein M9H77_07720 [Catharanthus roseus]|uniref:Uncharacterized protein n=1 Tax=Catharanthus roseus TaxID=4058 RepID=A0ACC0BVX6_CATRO|nr:hypothetical protein M9H77_07720 [Catharanthus roseus]
MMIGNTELTNTSNIVSGMSIACSGFEYNETEKKWVSRPGLSRREYFGFKGTRPTRCPGKTVTKGLEEEEGGDEDDKEGSDDKYEKSDPSFWASIAEMYLWHQDLSKMSQTRTSGARNKTNGEEPQKELSARITKLSECI